MLCEWIDTGIPSPLETSDPTFFAAGEIPELSVARVTRKMWRACLTIFTHQTCQQILIRRISADRLYTHTTVSNSKPANAKIKNHSIWLTLLLLMVLSVSSCTPVIAPSNTPGGTHVPTVAVKPVATENPASSGGRWLWRRSAALKGLQIHFMYPWAGASQKSLNDGGSVQSNE